MNCRIIAGVVCCCLLAAAPASGQTRKDEIQAVGDILTKNKCSVLDSKRSDGQPGVFYLSKPIDEPRDQAFDAVIGVGTLQKMGSGVSMSQNVGILYVIGQVQRASPTELAVQWQGCSGGPQELLIHVSAASRICSDKTSYSLEKLRAGDKITAKVKTFGTPKNSLIKAVLGDRTIKLRPFFQMHFVFLGTDFYDSKDKTCVQ